MFFYGDGTNSCLLIATVSSNVGFAEIHCRMKHDARKTNTFLDLAMQQREQDLLRWKQTNRQNVSVTLFIIVVGKLMGMPDNAMTG